MKSLQEFYNDKDTKENVLAYLIDFLEKEAIKKVFDKESFEEISAIGSAKEVIEKAFDNMDLMFQTKVNKKEVINEAR